MKTTIIEKMNDNEEKINFQLFLKKIMEFSKMNIFRKFRTIFFLKNVQKVHKMIRIMKKYVNEKNRFSTFPKKVLGFESRQFFGHQT